MAESLNLNQGGTKLEVYTTGKFKKSLKRVLKRGKSLEKISRLVKELANERTLPPSCREHALKGNYAGCMECHIEPDWLLVYKKDKGKLILVLMDTGTHSDLFDE